MNKNTTMLRYEKAIVILTKSPIYAKMSPQPYFICKEAINVNIENFENKQKK